MPTIEWYGQACFKIDDSLTLVTDPHDGDSVGLNSPPADVADLITISHGHFDHSSGEELVAGKDSITLTNPGEYTEKNVIIKGIESFHDKAEGAKRGRNVIFIFELGGYRICHLGDLGHQLGEEQINRLGSIDILLVPVGGNYTIDGSEAFRVTTQLNPQMVIPMHYKVKGLEVDIAGPEKFLNDIGNSYQVRKMDKLNTEDLPGEKLAVKLACMANE